MKNQTDPSSLLNLDPNEIGTGLFLVPDPNQADYGAATKLTVQDITYGEAVVRGTFSMAFKWIKGGTKIPNKPCGQPCVASCVEIGCLCNYATGRCE